MQLEPRPDLRERALRFWKRIGKLGSHNFIRPSMANHQFDSFVRLPTQSSSDARKFGPAGTGLAMLF
jgi:hypothetical protein